MEKPQFWILKNEKGKPFSLKASAQEIEIPERTVEKVFASFFEVFKEYQARKKEKLNLFVGVKPKNESVEVKFFVGTHDGLYYRSKNSPWRFFMIPSFEIKKIEIEFENEVKLHFIFIKP